MLRYFMRNPVIQENTARLEEIPGFPEVFGKLFFSDMFEHSHADNFIETLSIGEIAIIRRLYAAKVLNARLTYPFLREIRLRPAESYAGYGRPEP